MESQTLVTCFVVHLMRESKLVWTNPESFSRESAEAYVTSFNASEKARTHAEWMVVVEQQVQAQLPPDVANARPPRDSANRLREH